MEMAMDRFVIGFYRSNTGFYESAAAADHSKMVAEYFVFAAYLSKLIFYRSKIAAYHSTGIAYRYKMIFHWYKMTDYHSKMVLDYSPAILGKSAMIFYWYKLMVEYFPVILEYSPTIPEQYGMNLESSPAPTKNAPPISIHSPLKLVQKLEPSKREHCLVELVETLFPEQNGKDKGRQIGLRQAQADKTNLIPCT